MLNIRRWQMADRVRKAYRSAQFEYKNEKIKSEAEVDYLEMEIANLKEENENLKTFLRQNAGMVEKAARALIVGDHVPAAHELGKVEALMMAFVYATEDEEEDDSNNPLTP